MAEPILNKARAEQNLAETSVESNVKYELSEELLKELSSNTYNGRAEEDVVSHIAKILEILDSIEEDDMDPFQLRMKTFPLLLSGKARKWWMNEGDGKIITWEELVNKFFGKFYPLSCASNYDKMCEDDEEEVGNNEGLMDEDISSDDDRDQTNSSIITKPEIKIDELRLQVFSKSLSKDAKKWLSSEGTVTTWKELIDKFFHKYYPLSHTYKSKIPDDLDHGTDYFDFSIVARGLDRGRETILGSTVRLSLVATARERRRCRFAMSVESESPALGGVSIVYTCAVCLVYFAKEMVGYVHVRMSECKIQRISLTGFPAQSVGSSNTDVLDSPCLLVLITGTSQSRQHGKSESDSYYLSDLVVNSFTGPKLISSYHKLDSYRILQVTYQELV
ncbi:hypothetical protein Tco_0503397 [Tanacetum coccineum]